MTSVDAKGGLLKEMLAILFNDQAMMLFEIPQHLFEGCHYVEAGLHQTRNTHYGAPRRRCYLAHYDLWISAFPGHSVEPWVDNEKRAHFASRMPPDS